MTQTLSMRDTLALAERIVQSDPASAIDTRSLAFAVLRLESALRRAGKNDRSAQYRPGEARADGRAPDLDADGKPGRWPTPREIVEALLDAPEPPPAPEDGPGRTALAVDRAYEHAGAEGPS